MIGRLAAILRVRGVLVGKFLKPVGIGPHRQLRFYTDAEKNPPINA